MIQEHLHEEEARLATRQLCADLSTAILSERDLDTLVANLCREGVSLAYHRLAPCSRCSDPGAEKLNCEHHLCGGCVQAQLASLGNGEVLKHNLAYLQCPKCPAKIHENLGLAIYRSRRVQPRPQSGRVQVSCLVCYGEYSV